MPTNLTSLRLAVCLLSVGGLLFLLGDAAPARAADERDLEPVPPMIAFPDLDENEAGKDETRLLIRREISRTFASLGDIEYGRRLLVYRFGLISAPELTAVLITPKVQAEVWNAALTIAALRDTYGPALELSAAVRALQKRLLIQSQDFHTPAFAALAAGSFHWPQGRLPARYERLLGYDNAVPGPARATLQTVTAFKEIRALLIRLAAERKQDFLQVAAMLALAKMGGPEARDAFADGRIPDFTTVHPQQARLIAHAFLEVGDPAPLYAALRDEDRRVRAGAALAIAVAVLQRSPQAWTTRPARPLKELTGSTVRLGSDEGPEAVFARGAIAIRRQTNEEWNDIWRLATLASSERRVAEAAAQVLLFCEMAWFEDALVKRAVEPGVVLKDPVLALVLLRAGAQGTEEAIGACEQWLKSKAKRPVPTAQWDPRWYAAVGLLRALHAGHVKVRERRERVVKALERAVARVLDRKAPIREALQAVLEAHGRKIIAAEEDDLYRLPLAALRRVEDSVTCPHSLLSRDVVDVCVRRVNDLVQLMFALDSIDWSPTDEARIKKQPEKHLQRYLDEFPYFSRLEFRDDRGRRPAPALAPGASGIDR